MENDQNDTHVMYRIKWIKYNSHIVPILLQSTDGECPFICLINILLLSRRFTIGENETRTSFYYIYSSIASLLPDEDPEWLYDTLSSLRFGLIFNCKFDDTNAIIDDNPKKLFQLFNIPIKHGWIAEEPYSSILNKYTYDEIQTKLAIHSEKSSNNTPSNITSTEGLAAPPEVTATVPTAVEASSNSLPANGIATPGDRGDGGTTEDVTSSGLPVADPREAKGEVNKEADDGNVTSDIDLSLLRIGSDLSLVYNFFDIYATQLTEVGLAILKTELMPNTLAAMYRNNHFLVVTLHNGVLYSLITDLSFLSYDCLWESLDDFGLYDYRFKPFVLKDVQQSTLSQRHENDKPTLLQKLKGFLKLK